MKLIRWFSTRYKKNDISAHSAQVSFFVVISFFPFVLFFLTLLHFTPITQEILLKFIDMVSPSLLNDTINKWIREVYQQSSGTFISISIITALWASSKSFLGLIAGIQKVYNVKETRNFIQLRIWSLFYTISFSILIILSLVILVYGNRIFLFINNHIPVLGNLFNYIFSFRVLIGLSLFMLIFALMFTFIPNCYIRFRSQIPGAFLAAILWIGFSYLYSLYIDHFSNMATLYGSLTQIVIFMLWLFFCINFIFIGAEVNVYLSNHPNLLSRSSKKSSKDNKQK